MELRRDELIRAAVRNGVRAPDGPVIEHFERLEIAAAIMQEVNRVGHLRDARISLHMDIADALALAALLRGDK